MKNSTILLAATVLSLILLGGALLASSTWNGNVRPEALTTLQNQRIWFTPGSNPLYLSVLSRIRDLGPVQLATLDPSSMTESDTLSLTSSPSSIVLFDGDWLATHRTDTKTLKLFKMGQSHIKFATIGGDTSVFFEILHASGIYTLAMDSDGTLRNPDSMDAPLVGIRLKLLTTPTGTSYLSPNILISNTTDATELADALGTWAS